MVVVWGIFVVVIGHGGSGDRDGGGVLGDGCGSAADTIVHGGGGDRD